MDDTLHLYHDVDVMLELYMIIMSQKSCVLTAKAKKLRYNNFIIYVHDWQSCILAMSAPSFNACICRHAMQILRLE